MADEDFVAGSLDDSGLDTTPLKGGHSPIPFWSMQSPPSSNSSNGDNVACILEGGHSPSTMEIEHLRRHPYVQNLEAKNSELKRELEAIKLKNCCLKITEADKTTQLDKYRAEESRVKRMEDKEPIQSKLLYNEENQSPNNFLRESKRNEERPVSASI